MFLVWCCSKLDLVLVILGYKISTYNCLEFQEEPSQMAEAAPSLKTFPGQASPLGVLEVDNGINFAIFSQHATAVTLCLQLPQR